MTTEDKIDITEKKNSSPNLEEKSNNLNQISLLDPLDKCTTVSNSNLPQNPDEDDDLMEMSLEDALKFLIDTRKSMPVSNNNDNNNTSSLSVGEKEDKIGMELDKTGSEKVLPLLGLSTLLNSGDGELWEMGEDQDGAETEKNRESSTGRPPITRAKTVYAKISPRKNMSKLEKEEKSMSRRAIALDSPNMVAGKKKIYHYQRKRNT